MTASGSDTEKTRSCSVFETTLPRHFSGRACSIVLTRHCLLCGGAMVVHILEGVPGYQYFEVGSTNPGTEPFPCKESHPDQKSCVHNWITLVDSHESNADYRAAQRHWCSRCGDYRELPKESLPAKGPV